MDLIPLFPATSDAASSSRAAWDGLTPEQQHKVRQLLWRWRSDPARFAWDLFRIELWHRQVEICQAVATHKRVAVKSGHKIGKAEALDTPIPTPTGWTNLGDLKVGDKVFDEMGRPCNVVGLSPIWYDRPCYDVEFSDGTVVTADAEHEWFTWTAKARRAHFRAKHPKDHPSIVTTREISETLTAHMRGRNHAIKNAAPLELPEVDLPLDPYVFGAWLGDGDSNSGTITCGDDDLIKEIERIGAKTTLRKSCKPADYKAKRYGLGSIDGKVVTTTLRKMGVLHNKHVPMAYLRASKEQRLALLQGLLDTDGSAARNGSVEFCNTNKRIADAVFELVASLGMKPTIAEGRAKLYGRDISAKYRVTFTPHIPVFRIKRKLVRQHTGKTKSTWVGQRSIVAVRPVPSVPVRCIEVDSPSHLYLCSRAFIPTHNSVTAAVLALWWAITRKNGRVILTAPSANQIRNILWMELTKLVNAANRRPAIKALGGLGGHLYEAPDRGFQLGPGHEIAGRATNEPERMAGTSGDELLYLVDEASGIDQRIFEAIEGNLTGGGRVVLFSNPTQVSGEFFDAFHSKAGLYHCITVSSEETPNAKTGVNQIKGLATREAILDNRKAWGPDWKNDVRYQVRVLGMFPAKSAYAVITLDDVRTAKDRFYDLIGLHFETPELCTYLPDEPGTPKRLNPYRVDARNAFIADDHAMTRALAWYESSRMEDETLRTAPSRERHDRWLAYLVRCGAVTQADIDAERARVPNLPRYYYQRFPLQLGVDVARYGTDLTVVTPRRGPRVFRPRTLQLGGAKEVARFVLEIAHGRAGHLLGLAAPGERPRVLIDEIGEGAGATDILIGEHNDVLEVIPVRSSNASSDPENHVNLRTELHFAARDWLRRDMAPGPIDFDNHGIVGGMFPPLQILEDDLVAPQYSFTPKGQFKVESKDDIKGRIGRSPDHGDSFFLAVHRGHIVTRIAPISMGQDFAREEPRMNRDERGW